MALLSSPATVSLKIGSNSYSWDAEAGVSIGSVAFPTEDAVAPTVAIVRDGTTVKSGTGSKTVNKSGCTYYNFNPIVNVV